VEGSGKRCLAVKNSIKSAIQLFDVWGGEDSWDPLSL